MSLPQSFSSALSSSPIPIGQRAYFQQWVSGYLAFCQRENADSKSQISLDGYVRELQDKKRQDWQCEQAKKAVQLYFRVTQDASVQQVTTNTQGQTWDTVLLSMENAILLKHYSRSTLKNYTGWVKRFRLFAESKNPCELRSSDARLFLEDLAVRGHVSAKTQNLAFNALLFLYKNVLDIPFDNMAGTLRAKSKPALPSVLSVAETEMLLNSFDYSTRLVAELLYGCGLRLNEALSLRTQDIDFTGKILMVKNGKGGKDRTLPLPQSTVERLQKQIAGDKVLNTRDCKDESYEGVFLPESMERKSDSLSREFAWYWVFPGRELTLLDNGLTKKRYHLHATAFQRNMQDAVRKAGLTRRVTAHTLRHSFATHLLGAGYDIRQVQDLLGHTDVRTTMIYTHILRPDAKPVRSPLDLMRENKGK